MHFNLKENT